MDVLRALFRSRKFVAGLSAIIVATLVELGVPEGVSSQLIDAITVIAVAYIGGTAIEDAMFKRALQIEGQIGPHEDDD